MLAERFEIHVDEAFERLRHQARSRRMKLHVLAAAVTAREAWSEAIFRETAPGGAAQRGGLSSTASRPAQPVASFSTRHVTEGKQ